MYLDEREKRDEERGRDKEREGGKRERRSGGKRKREGGGCQANFGDAAFSAALFSDTMERRGWDSWPFFLGSVLVRGRTR